MSPLLGVGASVFRSSNSDDAVAGTTSVADVGEEEEAGCRSDASLELEDLDVGVV